MDPKWTILVHLVSRMLKSGSEYYKVALTKMVVWTILDHKAPRSWKGQNQRAAKRGGRIKFPKITLHVFICDPGNYMEKLFGIILFLENLISVT